VHLRAVDGGPSHRPQGVYAGFKLPVPFSRGGHAKNRGYLREQHNKRPALAPKLEKQQWISGINGAVSYKKMTLPNKTTTCRYSWSPDH
ncbi:hypothetical protein ACVGW2_00480, partial [Enterobacter intestinihominis]